MKRWQLFFWFLLIPLAYVLPLLGRRLWLPDELRYGEISREMLAGGSWISPHFLGLRYFEKPAGGLWINALGMGLFGQNNFGVRAGAVISTLLAAAIVSWLAMHIWRDRRTALTALAIYLSSFLVYAVGTYGSVDAAVTLWLVAAMAAFWVAAEAKTRNGRIGGYLLLGVACGLGFLTKGFLALAVPVVGVLPFVIVERRWREVLTYGPLAILSAALVSAPWAIAVWREQPDFWNHFFWVEHIQRFADSAHAQHKEPFWFYIPLFILGTVPWLALLPASLAFGWTDRRKDPALIYLLGWVVMPLAFFSLAEGKLPTYILPCMAPLALLMARRARTLGTDVLFVANGWINLVLGLGLGLAAVALMLPWSVALKLPYASGEGGKLAFVALALLVWGGIGWLTLRRPGRRWHWAALCPIGAALVVGGVLPQTVVTYKNPQWFLGEVAPALTGSRYVLAYGPAWASAVAYTGQRDDVLIYNWPGEVAHGLSYPDSADRLVTADAFPDWLASHRHDGNVSLVMPLAKPDQPVTMNPAPDRIIRQGRMALFWYKQQ
ncbi:lipid IV(A) 4-amino-4-deoxy-L-arabinosyltransferase [Pleomorphomonas oryzae]|uniref:lipid IV(A) 4-amino-4-deoxy-L-arabinosyltransferase n=1 Tax=Pleomorphomonas oryzae TaxID=261934 RepID=UPI0004124461|nr:lipid IV(A) 4-amino-4-deoxy-L-arabinosyltransferase [Pleomorphomonas oryzae]